MKRAVDSVRRIGLGSLLGLLVALALLLGLVHLFTGYPQLTDYSRAISNGVSPDVLHERASASEALGGNAHRSVSEDSRSELSAEHLSGGPSPRPPSALLLQTPLLLIPEKILMPVVMAAILCLLGWIAWLGYRISGLDAEKILWVAPALVISLPVVIAISWSPIYGVATVALILTAWRYQDRPWAGILLGLAAGLRLWPGLVVVGFWIAGRRRLAYQAVTTFVIVNLVGVLLPGVTVEGSLDSMLQGADHWISNNQNSSLAGVLWAFGVPALLTTTVVSLIGLWAALRNRASSVPITIVAALIASPLSWPPYVLTAIPVAGLYARYKSHIPILVMVAASGSWSFLPNRWYGVTHLLILSALFVLISRPDIIDLDRGPITHKDLVSPPPS